MTDFDIKHSRKRQLPKLLPDFDTTTHAIIINGKVRHTRNLSLTQQGVYQGSAHIDTHITLSVEASTDLLECLSDPFGLLTIGYRYRTPTVTHHYRVVIVHTTVNLSRNEICISGVLEPL